MGAQRRQRGKPQHTGPHLRFSGCAGRRSAWFSLLPFCQTASAFRLICLFHTFFRCGVYRTMVFCTLEMPQALLFPICLVCGQFLLPVLLITYSTLIWTLSVHMYYMCCYFCTRYFSHYAHIDSSDNYTKCLSA